jgi:hypothetical protein
VAAHTITCIQFLPIIQTLRFARRSLPLPPEAMENMEKLSLSKNNFKTLPEGLGAMTNLRELYVNGNLKFSSLPVSVGNLRSLRELALRGCPKLKSIPSSVTNCEGLKELDLRTGGKKDVCKVPQEIVDHLGIQKCKVKGAVVKKAKGKKGKKKK